MEDVHKLIFQSNYDWLKNQYHSYECIKTLNNQKLKNVKALLKLVYSGCKDEIPADIFIRQNKSEITLIAQNIHTIFSNTKQENCNFFIPAAEKFEVSILENICKSWIENVLTSKTWVSTDSAISKYISTWLSYNFASVTAIQIEDFDQMVKITELADFCFYNKFCDSISNEWIDKFEKLLVDNNRSDIEMLEKIHKMSGRNLDNYLQDIEQSNNLGLWKRIKKDTYWSDYINPDSELNLKNNILLSNSITLWCDFLNNLRLPIIQSSILNSVRNPYTFIEIIKFIHQQNGTNKYSPYISLLILDKWFHACINTSTKLLFYKKHTKQNHISPFDKSASLLAFGEKVYSKWEEDKLRILKEGLENLMCLISYSDIEDWLFDINPIDNNSINDSAKIFNQTLLDFTNIYLQLKITSEKTSISLIPKTEIENLQHFMFQCMVVQAIPATDRETASTILLNNFISFASTKRFFWNMTFNDMHINNLRCLSLLLSMTKIPVKSTVDLLCQLMLSYQGWNVKPELQYKCINTEIFAFCGAGLLLEIDEIWESKESKLAYFDKISTLLFQQVYNGYDMVSQYYQTALLLYYFIVSQILPERKERYENELINTTDSLEAVLRVLCYDKINISNSALNLLKTRIHTELPSIKKRLEQQSRHTDWDIINTHIVKLGL